MKPLPTPLKLPAAGTDQPIPGGRRPVRGGRAPGGRAW